MNCHNFQERLAALRQGELGEAERAELERHARECSDCQLLLAVQQHLSSPTGEELEAEVPAAYVSGMWDRVAGSLGLESKAPGRFGGGWPGQRFLMPALAAAVVILIFVSGVMFGQLRQLQQREDRLVHQLELQLWHGEEPRSLSALNPERGPRPGISRRAWQRAVAGRDLNAAQLCTLLEQLPPETVLLSARQLAALRWTHPHWQALYRDRALSGIRTVDGLQAEEILRLLDSLPLDPDATIAGDRLLDLTTDRHARWGL
jgi:hypothetical protein